MCFWSWTVFSGLWWVFPLAFIMCLVVMFLVMRTFFAGRLACGPMHRDTPGGDRGGSREETGSRKGMNVREDGYEGVHRINGW